MIGNRYAPGTFVRHPKRTEWGLGKVLAIVEKTVVAVFKDDSDGNVRRIRVDIVPLKVSKVKADPILDALPSLKAFADGWRLGDPNFEPLWREIAKQFVAISGGNYPVTPSDGPFARFMQLHIGSFGSGDIHYEWLLRVPDRQLDVSLHVELRDRAKSLRWLDPVIAAAGEIGKDIGFEFECGSYGEVCAQATFVIPFEYQVGAERAIAPIAAQTMTELISRTLHLCPRKQFALL